MHKRTISIDFDGVLHSYTSGWKGVDVILDPPVPGAIKSLVDLVLASNRDLHGNAVPKYCVAIFSSRSDLLKGRIAMTKWLREAVEDYLIERGEPQPLAHIQADSIVDQIQFPSHKPPAHLTIDDRAFCFTGTFPTMDYIDSFRPWTKKEG